MSIKSKLGTFATPVVQIKKKIFVLKKGKENAGLICFLDFP